MRLTIAVAFVLTALLSGCFLHNDTTERPTDEVALEAVRRHFRYRHQSYADSIVTDLNLRQWGTYNLAEKYWPVSVSGQYTVWRDSVIAIQQNYYRLDFALTRDEFDGWWAQTLRYDTSYRHDDGYP
jgi:hypothetical protein